MATGRFQADGNSEGDGASPNGWVQVTGNGCHISLQGTFGGGSIAIQQELGSLPFPLLDLGVAVVITAADNSEYQLYNGDRVRLVLTGSTTPDIQWSITFGKP